VTDYVIERLIEAVVYGTDAEGSRGGVIGIDLSGVRIAGVGRY